MEQFTVFPTIVGGNDTIENLMLMLETEAGIEITQEAIGVLQYTSRTGFPAFVGPVNARVITPRERLRTEEPMPAFEFHDAALRAGMRPLPLLAALRFALILPPGNGVVRCGMEPLTDGSGYDFVLVIDNAGDETVVRADYSGLYDRTQMIDPDQKVLYRYEDPAAR